MAVDVIHRSEVRAILIALSANNVVPPALVEDLKSAEDIGQVLRVIEAYQMGYSDALDRVLDAIVRVSER